MDNAAPTPQSSATTDVPVALAKPFYPRALMCFIVSTLCLAWLVSLQVQSARHASIVIAPQNEVAPPKLVEQVVDTPVESKPSAPVRDVTDADFAIAEIELLHKLVLEDSSLNLKKTSNVLRTYTYSTNEAVRAAALRELSQVNSLHDRAALKSISDALTPAQALADKKDFVGALDILQATLKSLPQDPAGSGQSAENRLRDLIAEYSRQRVTEREAALGGLEADLRKKVQGSEARLAQALAHVDPAVRDDAKAIQQRHLESNDKDLQNKRSVERNAREEWVRFFKRFGGAVSDGDFTGASDLIEQPPFEAILKGGVSDPEKVLRRCADDIKAIQNVYEEALKDVKGMRRAVSFHLRKGGQASGMLIGANGHLLRVVPGKGAEIGVKISDLNSEGVKSIMDSGLKNKPSIQLALAAMEAYETPADAESIITAAYEKAREPIPLNWSERFKIEKLMLKITAAEVKLKALEKAVKADNGDEIKAALTEAKAVVAELNEAGALSEENRELLSKAEASSAKKALATVVLQNGKLPDPTYRGFNTDQISDYRDAMRRTDVGIGYGLRLGADGGLKRVLLKYDGLDVAVGNGRVRRATLQFYQIDSPKYDGASIGVFRIKRPWVPDSGSWISYDGQKDHDWTIPGASGEADIEPREDAKVLIDGKPNKWVSWDITKYVQDVIAGKVQNNGLLIKIVNGEPEYHVRFYPESDLDRNKDISLRPKLVLDIGWDLE